MAQRKYTERGNCGSSGRRDCTIDCTGSKKRGIREHEMPLWEYRKKWYGETEEQAKAAVQQVEDNTVIE